MKDPAGSNQMRPEDSSRPHSEYVNPSITELIEEASFRSLEVGSSELLCLVNELVRRGKTPEEVIDYFVNVTKLERYRVAYLGCAASYIIKLNRIPVSGEMQ